MFCGLILGVCGVFVGCGSRGTNETPVVPNQPQKVEDDPDADFIRDRHKRRDQYHEKKQTNSGEE